LLVSNETLLSGATPFCHIVIPATLITALLNRTIIFPGSMLGGYASVAGMLVIWIGASLALGRGWCAWGCFFGGLDEGFSRILKKPIIRDIPPAMTDLPFALLLIVAFWSTASMAPQYCAWLCPFKAVTEFRPVVTGLDVAKTAAFVSLFLGFVVALPLLTKRRAQCALLCPFGAMQSAANKLAPCDVRLDASACSKCGLCIRQCPTYSLSDASLVSGEPALTCARCGHCVDSCPKGAWHHHVRGTGSDAGRTTARLLFLYPAFLFLATIAGGIYQDGLARLGRLVLTGRPY
jgi:polyferredoxin